MSGDVANPRIWEGCSVYHAPVGTAGPTDVTTDLNAAFEDLGLLSDETGMVESRSETVTDHYAWGNILVRTTRSKHKRTLRVAFLEDNPSVFEVINPGSLTYTAGGTTIRTVKRPESYPRAWVLETTDGTNVRRRHIPRGEVIEVADIEHSEDSMTMFEATISVYPDADGVLWYDISNDDQVESS